MQAHKKHRISCLMQPENKSGGDDDGIFYLEKQTSRSCRRGANLRIMEFMLGGIIQPGEVDFPLVSTVAKTLVLSIVSKQKQHTSAGFLMFTSILCPFIYFIPS